MNSYQKLKQKHQEEVKRLRADLLTMVNKPDSPEASTIRMRYAFYEHQSKYMTYGQKMSEIGFGRNEGLNTDHYEAPKK